MDGVDAHSWHSADGAGGEKGEAPGCAVLGIGPFLSKRTLDPELTRNSPSHGCFSSLQLPEVLGEGEEMPSWKGSCSQGQGAWVSVPCGQCPDRTCLAVLGRPARVPARCPAQRSSPWLPGLPNWGFETGFAEDGCHLTVWGPSLNLFMQMPYCALHLARKGAFFGG